MTNDLDQLPSPPQEFVPGGWKRDYEIICDRCQTLGHFTIYTDRRRIDEWCEQALRQNMRESYWLPGDDIDYCPACKFKSIGS